MRTDMSPRTMDDDKVNDEGVVVSVYVATQSQFKFKLPSASDAPVARKREAFFGLMLRSPVFLLSSTSSSFASVLHASPKHKHYLSYMNPASIVYSRNTHVRSTRFLASSQLRGRHLLLMIYRIDKSSRTARTGKPRARTGSSIVEIEAKQLINSPRDNKSAS